MNSKANNYLTKEDIDGEIMVFEEMVNFSNHHPRSLTVPLLHSDAHLLVEYRIRGKKIEIDDNYFFIFPSYDDLMMFLLSRRDPTYNHTLPKETVKYALENFRATLTHAIADDMGFCCITTKG